jgi:predicted DNA-binding transcriptional regulator AlpA
MPSGVYPRKKAPSAQRRRHHLDRRAQQLLATGEGDADELMSQRAVAEWLGVSGQWLSVGRHRGFGPPFVRLTPRMVRYRRGDVRAWLESRRYSSTAEYKKRPAHAA